VTFRLQVSGSNYTVNAFGWLPSAKYLGATTVNGQAVQEFYAQVSETKFTLYVQSTLSSCVFRCDPGA
jgi:hypothetical protein